ncbi:MAG: MCE family protein [Bacteroidetes bacterium]|nr:MCE family protein [Bacteroidota bacterium]HET6245082.1 MlaD family protein [Bacteroidia bacterium]
MKKTTGNNIRLGILVSTGFILFIAGIYFIGQKENLFSSTFHISGIFKDVSGLQVGNNVRFSGINVGIIESIQQITDSTVKVDMVINENSRHFIKKNAKALIGSDGLMGNKIMLIIPGTPGEKELSDNDFIETSQPVNMDEILLNLKITSENAATITTDFAAIMANISKGNGTIGKLFMDTVFAKNLDQTIKNLQHGTKGFEENMDAAKNSFLLRGSLKRKERKELKEEQKNSNKK